LFDALAYMGFLGMAVSRAFHVLATHGTVEHDAAFTVASALLLRGGRLSVADELMAILADTLHDQWRKQRSKCKGGKARDGQWAKGAVVSWMRRQ
jgi:predicted DCC family thiol-disulfide oxidoreductase YuxK